MADNEDEMSVDSLVTGTGNEDTDSTKTSSSSSSGKREPITVSCRFGTELYEKDTECEECTSKAEGVLVYDGELFGRNPGIETGRPLCKTHRRELEAKERFDLDGYDYETFR